MIALLLLVVVITTIWATFDAGTNEGFGTAIVVLIGCAALWILVFPLYLVKRGQRERGRGMRRLALALTVAVSLLAPATAGAHAATDPVALAVARAEAYWHAMPCAGRVGFTSRATVPAQLEVEPASYASSATSPMWSSWQTADGPQSYTAPAYDCLTTVNATVWPNWHAMDVGFQAFCDEVTHEVGHFLGHPDSGQTEPASIEYPFLGLANFNAVPECRGLTLYYGHEAIRDPSEAEATCEARRSAKALAEGKDSWESC